MSNDKPQTGTERVPLDWWEAGVDWLADHPTAVVDDGDNPIMYFVSHTSYDYEDDYEDNWCAYVGDGWLTCGTFAECKVACEADALV